MYWFFTGYTGKGEMTKPININTLHNNDVEELCFKPVFIYRGSQRQSTPKQAYFTDNTGFSGLFGMLLNNQNIPVLWVEKMNKTLQDKGL